MTKKENLREYYLMLVKQYYEATGTNPTNVDYVID
jgi:hypothetical protein